ncbi:hypothetical protein N657DRAFT_641882 [Parathielavia appendiculata]|uniref:Uncharacterized protein n=1 Tax=Parathielavia appendiculata TaxID=2587402 RepID=A0AAN6U7E4_9PEZI|nr:hypothetical protein N657DRAFT_641882 [Parathielavia appendiculata]
MVGVPQHQVSGGAYTFDTMLSELSRQLAGNTRRYSRSSNGQQRVMGNAMRIAKPGSASNSPRSSTLQSRRRTLVGDGFQGGLHTPSPAADNYLPTPSSEAASDVFFERGTATRPARPLSWHPSSQGAPSSQHLNSNDCAMLHPYPPHGDIDMLASLQHLPPTPVGVYSGYTSPAESFSPLSLPYSSFSSSSRPFCSPVSQPVPIPQQQQQPTPAFHPANPCADYPPSTASLAEIPYLPPLYGAGENGPLAWEAYQPYPANTAPPTPEDLACGALPITRPMVDTIFHQQQQQQQQPPAEQEPLTQQTTYRQPLIIHDDDNINNSDGEGEILYGMGLYDAPDHGKEPSSKTLHRSVVLSLLGGTRDPEDDGEENEEEDNSGKGLGLKLEDAWEPPASEDEGEDEERGGQGEDEE